MLLCVVLYLSSQEQNEYRGVEQLVARRAHNPEVIGSNPFPATTLSAWKRYPGGFFSVFKASRAFTLASIM